MPGFGKRISQGLHVWQDDKSWQSNLDFAKKLGVKIISYTSPKSEKFFQRFFLSQFRNK